MGLWNRAGSLRGAQVGLVNRAGRVHGLQERALAHQRDESVNFNLMQIYANTIDVARYGDFITPETETTTHYFWAQAHNFRLDDPTVTELVYRQVHTAFLEDLFVIGAQQGNLTAFGDDLPPAVDFNQDAGGLQARRVIERILADEQAATTVRATA